MSHYKTLYKIEHGRINEEEKKSKLSNLFSRSKPKVAPPKLKSSSLQSGFPENPFPSLDVPSLKFRQAPKTSVPTFKGPMQYPFNRKGSAGSISSNDIPSYVFHRKGSTGAIYGPPGGGLLPPPAQHRRPSLAPPAQSAWVPQMPAGVPNTPTAPWVQRQHQKQLAQSSQPRMQPPRPLQVPQNLMPQQAVAQQSRPQQSGSRPQLTVYPRANPPTPRTPKAFSMSTTPNYANQYGFESAYLKLSLKSPRASEPVPVEYQNFAAFQSAVTPMESSFESLKDTTSPRSQYSRDYSLSPTTPRIQINAQSSHKRNMSSATFGEQNVAPVPSTRGARLGRAMRQAQPVDSWATEDSWATDFDATSQRSSSSSSDTSTLRDSVNRDRSVKAQGLKQRIQSHRGQMRKKKYSKYQLNDEDMDRVTAFKKKHLIEEQRPVHTPPLVDDVSETSSDDESLVEAEGVPATNEDDEEALLDEVDAFLDFYLNEGDEEPEKLLAPVAVAVAVAAAEEEVSRQESLQRRKQALLRKITVIRTMSKKRTHKRQPSREEQDWETTLHDLEDELCNLEQEREHYFDGYEEDRVEVRVQDGYIPPTSQLEAEVEEEYLAVRKASAVSIDDEPEPESYLFKGDEMTIFRGSMAVNRQTMPPSRRATRIARETMAFNAPIFQKV